MKNIASLSIIITLFTYQASAQISQTITFSGIPQITTVKLADSNYYSKFDLVEINTTNNFGYPQLPVKYATFIVPVNSENYTVSFVKSGKQSYTLPHTILPSQNNNSNDYVDTFYTCDSNGYNSNFYPSSQVTVINEGKFKGDKLITLAIYPCQYLGINKVVDFYTSITLNLSYTLKEQSNYTTMKELFKAQHLLVLQSMVENDNDILQNSVVGRPSSVSTNILNKLGIPAGVDYLIVTNNILKPSFNEFVAWKRRKGISTYVATIEEVYANYTGDMISGITDNAGKLRQFLADAYNNGNGIEYVLLGGDNTILPIRYGVPSMPSGGAIPYEEVYIPTDLYFAEYDGDWDRQNMIDDIYGDLVVDNPDYFPEVYLGRIMVKQSEEIKNWTRKLLNYEQNPGNGDFSYLNKLFFTVSDGLQNDGEAQKISNLCSWIPASSRKIFQENLHPLSSPTVPTFPKGIDVINEFNTKYGFTSFMNHGGPCDLAVATKGENINGDNNKYKITSFDNGASGCCAIPENGNSFEDMTNFNYPSIHYSIACETMPFDDYKTPPTDRNLGEAFTSVINGGGPIYIGSTRDINEVHAIYLFTSFAREISSGSNTFKPGVAETIAKNYEARTFSITRPDGHFIVQTLYMHNLLGCPELEMWTATPQFFTGANVVESGNDLIISTGSINDATICVMSTFANSLQHNATYNYYKRFTNTPLITLSDVPKPYTVTITKHNYIPYTKNSENMYIQNETIQDEKFGLCNNFYIGQNVTNTKTSGPVVIMTGANVLLEATNDIYILAGTEIQSGVNLELK